MSNTSVVTDGASVNRKIMSAVNDPVTGLPVISLDEIRRRLPGIFASSPNADTSVLGVARAAGYEILALGRGSCMRWGDLLALLDSVAGTTSEPPGEAAQAARRRDDDDRARQEENNDDQ